MTLETLGQDPLEMLVEQALRRLSDGEPPSRMEVERVDVKEEPGRRGAGGAVSPGKRENEQAASYLAEEMACMANTPGGGALIVGIADDGARIGTRLDADWLRYRIWELTSNKLTITARAANLDRCRILILACVEALDPVRYRGKLKWRVGANCVDVDPVVWRSRMLERIGFDWSDQPSGRTLIDVSPAACEVARHYLRESDGDESGVDLANATDADLLRRLNLVKDSNRLTNAGSLLFVDTPWPGVDYIRRDMPGGDSTLRIEGVGPLVTQVQKVEQAGEVANRVTHTAKGFAHGRIRAIPPRTLREAIVNGIVHRDWLSPRPTTIEHVGDTLTVTSPGGFLGGVEARQHHHPPCGSPVSKSGRGHGQAGSGGARRDRSRSDGAGHARHRAASTGHFRARRPLCPSGAARRILPMPQSSPWWPRSPPPGPPVSTRFCSSNIWPGMAGWTPSPLRPSSNGPPRLKPGKRSTGWRRFASTLTVPLP